MASKELRNGVNPKPSGVGRGLKEAEEAQESRLLNTPARP